jgi:hypothetical protein
MVLTPFFNWGFQAKAKAERWSQKYKNQGFFCLYFSALRLVVGRATPMLSRDGQKIRSCKELALPACVNHRSMDFQRLAHKLGIAAQIAQWRISRHNLHPL